MRYDIIIIKLTIAEKTAMRAVIDNVEKAMTISIDNVTLSTKAASGATIGTLTQTDSGGTVRATNFALTESAAGFFSISGNKLVTIRAQIPVGNYCVDVYANAQYVALTTEATFIINVTAT